MKTEQHSMVEELYKKIRFDLRLFIKRKIDNDEIVEDLLQEIFIKIYINIDQLKDETKLLSWTYQIARNSISDYFRKEKKARNLIESLQKMNTSTVEKTTDEILRFCSSYFISLLPEKYKRALIFTEFEGNTRAALAQKESISISAAKSRVQRARKRLKKLLLEFSRLEYDNQNPGLSRVLDHCPFCKK